jgi:hypothetical protein
MVAKWRRLNSAREADLDGMNNEPEKYDEAAANMNCLRTLLFLVAAIGFSGCAKTDSTLNATVQGTVTIDGELAPRGKVSLHNTGSGPSAYGTVHNDGTFTLRVGRGNVENQDASRIPAGEYLATVVVNEPSVANPERPSGPPLPGVRLTSAKYSSQVTSGLRYTINAGLNVINIDVAAPSDEELAVAEAAATEAAQGGSEDTESESTGTEVARPTAKDSAADSSTSQEVPR